MPILLFLIFVLTGLATSTRTAAGQEAVVAGAGATAGILGVELHWRPAGLALRFGTGVGVAGIGARAMLPLGRGDRRAPQRAGTLGYMSAGYLATPWRPGRLDAAGALVLERGVWILHGNERLLADLAAGVVLVHGGTWGGNALGPALRLQIGVRTGRS
jgi:hypothetical protein